MPIEADVCERLRLTDEARCWQAIQSRDTAADGTFVYAVRSTRTYCRPSCPSRLPRRDLVVFYSLPETAERCGFRPCRRCRPRDVATADPRVQMARQVCRFIEANLEEPLTLDILGQELSLSAAYLQRTFKRVTGITPRQYADACRLGRLKSRLKQQRTVTMALYEAGYGSSSRLYERAAQQLGMTPATYRHGGRGMKIGYTVQSCPLGRILLATTERGVCAVCLGDTDGPLETALRSEYPEAEIQREDDPLRPWLGELLEHLRGQRPHLDLPLDVQATAFQWRVWEELRKIPYGDTRSYSEIAAAIGQPTAARAVARACATNPVAVVVPCHRVVREGGGLGGYRWGIERKEKLLAQEQAEAGKSKEGERK